VRTAFPHATIEKHRNLAVRSKSSKLFDTIKADKELGLQSTNKIQQEYIGKCSFQDGFSYIRTKGLFYGREAGGEFVGRELEPAELLLGFVGVECLKAFLTFNVLRTYGSG
jgi:hypothetical protein